MSDSTSGTTLAEPRYWRSLAERAGTEEFRLQLEREFPAWAATFEGVSRRQFLKLMGASLALAGLNGCARQPPESIVPYVRAPVGAFSGTVRHYATAATIAGEACGLIVKTDQGRPVKIEGNPEHPGSLGATDAFAQASLLELYDPDRSQVVTRGGAFRSWEQFASKLKSRLGVQCPQQGRGLRILTETVLSPTLARQLRQVQEAFPESRWYQYSPVNRDQSRAGAVTAFGSDVSPSFQFNRADVILTLDADPLGSGPGHVRYAHDFAARRRDGLSTGAMPRLYAVESTWSLTGAQADHRLPLRPQDIGTFCRQLAARLKLDRLPPDSISSDLGEQEASVRPVSPDWIQTVVEDLQRASAPLVIVGESQPAAVHALVHGINQALGAPQKSLVYFPPAAMEPVAEVEQLAMLVDEMQQGQVDDLLIIGGNPVFDAPADLDFSTALKQVPFRARLGLYEDETSAACEWHLPAKHDFESWSDVRAPDGTTTIIQPLIEKLYQGSAPHEVVAMFTLQEEDFGPNDYELVRETWRQQRQDDSDFEAFWQRAVHDGVIPGTEFSPVEVQFQQDEVAAVLKDLPASATEPGTTDQLTAVFRPDPCLWDGRFANNGWLQELPKPFTRLTWDNAAQIAPETAQRLHLASEDLVSLIQGNRTVRMPVWITPGLPQDTVTLHFGYGRTQAGRVGDKTGFDVFPLRQRGKMWSVTVNVKTEGDRVPLACTQHHQLTEGRDLILSGTLAAYKAHPDRPTFMPHEAAASTDPAQEERPSIYPPVGSSAPQQWGMSINLTSCIGCNACVVACQAENNIPVVGREQVIAGREMHWIRVDTYYSGSTGNPRVQHQPVPCMHCEHAPCEPVCPVGATTHSDEGLNEMTYNRCVGTRYCSNNCPYKVRRFNFLELNAEKSELPVLQLLQNPEVSVRSRGVMEKCTYCVQRINSARIAAEKELRPIRDGEVITACQQVCPAQAIRFGNLSDPLSAVNEWKESPLNYALLAEHNTRPRTTYLAAVHHPHDSLIEEQEGAAGESHSKADTNT